MGPEVPSRALPALRRPPEFSRHLNVINYLLRMEISTSGSCNFSEDIRVDCPGVNVDVSHGEFIVFLHQ